MLGYQVVKVYKTKHDPLIRIYKAPTGGSVSMVSWLGLEMKNNDHQLARLAVSKRKSNSMDSDRQDN